MCERARRGWREAGRRRERWAIVLSHIVGSFSDPVLTPILFAVTIYSFDTLAGSFAEMWLLIIHVDSKWDRKRGEERVESKRMGDNEKKRTRQFGVFLNHHLALCEEADHRRLFHLAEV